MSLNRKVAILSEENYYTETLGWISDDDQMIRSPDGAVWIQIVNDVSEDGPEGVDTPPGMEETIIIGEIGEDDDIST